MNPNLRYNVNNIAYDLTDGGDLCHVCDKHLHNCEEHTPKELFGEEE